jgi:hypothetical protein
MSEAYFESLAKWAAGLTRKQLEDYLGNPELPLSTHEWHALFFEEACRDREAARNERRGGE